MKRICPKCNLKKDFTEFYYNKKTSLCKKCFSNYQIERWINRRKEFVLLKGGKCSICEYHKNLTALEFHHINPDEKEFNWGIIKKHTKEKILKELDKCILVCSNCHMEIHYNNTNNGTIT